MTETFASPPPGVLTRNAHAGPAGEYLSFRLGVEECGIDILRVQEIRSYERPTRLAHSPDFIKGVIDLRGRIVDLLGSGEIELVINATRG